MKVLKKLFTPMRERGTIKYMYPTIVTLVALLGAAVVTSGDVSHIRLVTPSTIVEADERFSIDVYAFAHVPVNAVDITLQFDSNAVKILGIDTGQSVITLWTQEPTIEENRIILRGGTYRNGFIGEHKIATLSVEATKVGQSNIAAKEVMLLAGDGEGSRVTVSESISSTVQLFIYDEHTDPETIAINTTVSAVTDIDGDGKLTLKDVSMFMSAWHSKAKIFDFTGDGRMTVKDFSILLANYFFQ